MSTRSCLLTACVALTLAAAAHAKNAQDGRSLADLSIEELMEVRVDSVYGASKHEQKVTQAPSSVSIVTAEEIRRFGYRTLADVLRGVRGFYVSDDRNYQYIGVRGFLRPGDYNSRILVTVDGHRMNDSIYDGAYAGREGMIDLELVERIEVIRGPSSSLYGSSAFFGVINVITKSGAQLGGVELAGEGGTYGARKGRFTYGQQYAGGLEWLVSGSQYRSDGAGRLYYPEFDQRSSDNPRAGGDGVAADLDAEDAQTFFTKVRYGEFSLAGFFDDRNKQIPTASFETIFGDPREETRDRRAYLELGYHHSVSEVLQVQARAYYDDYLYRGRYPYDYAAAGDPTDPVLYRDAAIGNWFGSELQLTAKLGGHTLQVGGEYRDNQREYQDAYYDVEPFAYDLRDDRSSSTLGLYAQDEVHLRDNLVLTAGLRFDRYFENFGNTFNPRLGLIYNVSQTSTLKALYGRAFRAPNAFERYYNPEQGNHTALQPETIRTYELAYEQYLGHRYRLSVSAYYYDVQRLITQTQTELGDQYFANLDDVRATGVEFEAEGKFDSGVQLQASYTLQKANDETSGMPLSSSPRHLAKLQLTVPVYGENVLASIELQYNGASRTIRGALADDFLLANLTVLSRELLPGLELSGGVYNLLGTRYGYPGAADHVQDVIEQNGRTVQARLSYKF